jgi:oxygen-independent coproporphyrinogen III oxidase
MCELTVDLAAIAAAHRREPDVFATELARIDAMADDGIATRDGYRVAVPEAARPYLRTVAAAFDRYLDPEAHRHSRAY